MSDRRPIAEVLAGRLDGVAAGEGPPVELSVPSGRLAAVCEALRDHPDLRFSVLYSVSGVDLEDRLQVVYHLFSPKRAELVVLKVDADRERPVVPSLAGLWRAADWHERECFDMFGITFEGHPDLRHLLVVDAAGGHLLRKDVPIRTVEEARERAH